MLSIVSIVLISQTSCIKKEEVDLEELLRNDGNRWDIVDHCSIAFEYHFSYVEFDRDGTGVFQVRDDCAVGFDCQHWITFRWDLDENAEEVKITWRNDNAIQICEEIQDNNYYIAPETFHFDAETERITVRGYTFSKD